MIVITNIEYRVDLPYKRLILRGLLTSGEEIQYIIDEQGIRALGTFPSKAVILRKDVAKIVVAIHKKGVFTILFQKKSSLKNIFRLDFRAFVEGNGQDRPTEIGTTFEEYDYQKIADDLADLGYAVELLEVGTRT